MEHNKFCVRVCVCVHYRNVAKHVSLHLASLQFSVGNISLKCEALHGSLHCHCHRHNAVMLMELIYYLDALLDQEVDGHHRAERV